MSSKIYANYTIANAEYAFVGLIIKNVDYIKMKSPKFRLFTL